MSGIIFVVLAIGWAVYLLPKALKRNDEFDRSRPVEEFSGAVRVLGRGVAAKVTTSTTLVTPAGAVENPVSTITREAARSAARRRRRVLALLLTTLVALTATSYLAYTPWFMAAIPAGLVLVFLVVARLTVRAQQVRRVAPVQHAVTVREEKVESVAVMTVDDVEPDLGTEDTQGLSREALAEAIAAPVLDEGGLWDPLPVTLPTYVNKARARRTVRTIEITGAAAGITSSGHDAADSALAAEAREAEQKVAGEVLEAEPEARKAAGA
jgi:hypothetical protein